MPVVHLLDHRHTSAHNLPTVQSSRSFQDENGNVAPGTPPSGSDTDASFNDPLPSTTSSSIPSSPTTSTTIPDLPDIPDPAHSAAATGPTSSSAGDSEQAELCSDSSSDSKTMMDRRQHSSNTTTLQPSKISWNGSTCSTLSVALLSIPFGVMLLLYSYSYSTVGDAFERLAERYLAATWLAAGLSD